MSRIYFLVVLIIIGLSVSPQAQDVSFSQFFAVPYQVNPALVGTIDGSYRVGAVYRDQWRGAADNPLTTIAVGAEVKFDLENNKKYKDQAGIGIFFLNDKINEFAFTTSQIAFSAAYHKILSQQTRQYIGIGTQVSVVQRNISYDQLDFGDEFNNIDGFDQVTGENLPPNNFGLFDMAVGINYTVKPTKKTALYLGGAMHHLTSPNTSFYANEENLNPAINPDVDLKPRYVFHVSVDQQIAEYTTLQPRILFQTQSPDSEIKIGTNVQQLFKGYRTGVYFGAWLSGVNNIDGFALNTFTPLVGFQKSSFIIGLSYDINLRQTFSGTAGLNAFEMSFRFLGNYTNDDGFCPEF